MLVMRRGGMVEEGAPARLLAAPSTDYARALAKAAPRMDSPAPDLPQEGEALLEAKGVRVSFRRPGWRGGWLDAWSDAVLDIRVGARSEKRSDVKGCVWTARSQWGVDT